MLEKVESLHILKRKLRDSPMAQDVAHNGTNVEIIFLVKICGGFLLLLLLQLLLQLLLLLLLLL